METEPTSSGGSRPRPVFLALLGIAVLALALMKLMPSGSATPGRPASNQPRPSIVQASGARVDPKDLDVRIEALSAARPEQGKADRNPFRFAPKPLPSIEPPERGPAPKGTQPVPAEREICGNGIDDNGNGLSDEGCGPPPPPPIPLKFIGIVEGQGKKLAALSDCKFTYRGEEGEIIDGRYRLIKIGVESVVIEYVDGRGRTTIRLSGQDCVGR